ncbi:ClpXP protease specificity-enhancing factor SspB [Rhodoplanes sp. TEM]|uniref:ClpXP protease specificity-enhancing factor SspB n=1 Tax=Rhodoplanes tepidamans TaxID=200616 RepID=A0ABT5J7I0_RHOTP|nr:MULTISPECIES: ClpXP protease specificity-enhancing factor SspB [Rhodoplanes]MDC7785592.1 ClpXP protease specificity-enhancing factor SspB [Rhodoplanes tepidamans]MDC7985209.1 ClpXP protease specificity-enhancing factor SspB [Rhodoplanes sp. TEM]MDQ0353238.1 hypothetical protein [Rhodoplanes tepidamans]
MPTDYIRYDILTQNALRGVVRTVLSDAAAKGLPGEHHFYVSFDTRAPGVKLSPRLLAQYPTEMTIVLQHQFWDLTVTEDGFEVGLSFNGIPERLVVPLTAIKGFFDPSVQFGLEFAVQSDLDAEAPEDEPAQAAGPPGAKPAGTPRPAALHKRTPPPAPEPLPTAANPTAEAGDPPPDKPAGGGEVVRLDRFRKK